MTRDDIIRMAKQVDMLYRENVDELHSFLTDGVYLEDLEAFAQLVAADAIAKEREACAKLCEESSHPFGYANLTAEVCAKAIRARGQQ